MRIYKVADINRGEILPSSPYLTEIYIYSKEGNEISIPVEVYFDVEPTEYEGGELFYQGGIVINMVKTIKPIKINGETYSAGTDVDDILFEIESDKTIEEINEGIIDELSKQGISPPSHRYRGKY